MKGDFYKEIKFLPIVDCEECLPTRLPGWEDSTTVGLDVDNIRIIFGTEFAYCVGEDKYKGLSDDVPLEVRKHCIAISRQERGLSFSEDATIMNFVSDSSRFSEFDKVHPPPKLHDGSFFFSCRPFTKDFVSWFIPVDKSLDEIEQTIVVSRDVNAKCYSKDTSSVVLSIDKLN